MRSVKRALKNTLMANFTNLSNLVPLVPHTYLPTCNLVEPQFYMEEIRQNSKYYSCMSNFFWIAILVSICDCLQRLLWNVSQFLWYQMLFFLWQNEQFLSRNVTKIRRYNYKTIFLHLFKFVQMWANHLKFF